MKKIYLDIPGNNCAGVFAGDAEVVLAGTTVYSMDVKDKNAEYQKYADTYDLRFIFDDDIPPIDFYTVPLVNIFAKDSRGGLFGTIGKITDMDEVAPICYISKNKDCFLIADSFKDFLQILASDHEWSTSMSPYFGVVFYKSKSEAKHLLEFLE